MESVIFLSSGEAAQMAFAFESWKFAAMRAEQEWSTLH